MRKLICIFLILLMSPIPYLSAQEQLPHPQQTIQLSQQESEWDENAIPAMQQEASLHVDEAMLIAEEDLSVLNPDLQQELLQTEASPQTEQAQPPASEAEGPLEEFITEPYTCMFCRTFALTLVQDAKHVLIFPTYYNRKKWLIFSGTVAGIVALSSADEGIQRAIQRNRHKVTDKAASIVNPFGFWAAYAVIATIYIHGAMTHNQKSKVVALDAVSASLTSWGVLATLTKFATGRARPSQNQGAFHFDPFTVHGEDNAFPSGHATQAFALAAVLATHYPRKAVIIPVYSFATLVGLARLNKNRHWTTDVVGGALMGTLIGREMVFYNRRKRKEIATKVSMSFVPLFDERGRSLNLFIHF